MKIAVYLSAVPAKSKNEFKRNLLAKFAIGARSAGDDVLIIDDVNRVAAADIAVLQGWIGMKQAPHLQQRQQVIEQQRSQHKHTLVIDSNLFGFLDPNDRDKYLRYSLDGIFPTTGYYFDRDIDPSRWQEICARYHFQEHPWRQGTDILICLQRDGGWSMDGLPVIDWLHATIERIMAVTDRPIVIRAHPGSLKVVPEIRRRWPTIAISDRADIRQDLDRAWCAVTYNSSPAVASILWGVPAFVTDPDGRRSQASGYADTDIAGIERPQMPDRQAFYHRLAQCHFATDQLETGDAWRFMRSRLP
jgi:hypothetical protein